MTMFRQTTQYGQSTDPDARAMTSAGRGTSIVGYNLQAAVDAEHHLIVAHELLNIGNDRGQLSSMAAKAKDAMGIDTLDAIADKGYFEGEDNRVESRRCGTYL